ncbi:helix-turn-helix domain-containing protein [Emticicia fontis]
MKETPIANCYVSPSLSNEQFISNHTFMYLVEGTMVIYDGIREYSIKSGDYGLGRRNYLAKYTKQPDKGAFRKIFMVFDQAFLKEFQEKYKFPVGDKKPADAILPLEKDKLVENFIQSLLPYFNENGLIDEAYLPIKRTELLLILLKSNPELANVFFDFSNPEKIDLEKFMNTNFRFNVSLEHFSYLTGRSLSAFKRDFEKIFHASPSHWLVQKRLEEAYYLIDKEHKRPSDIYLDLGFEDLSHFSFAFRKLFGHAPTQLTKAKKNDSQ